MLPQYLSIVPCSDIYYLGLSEKIDTSLLQNLPRSTAFGCTIRHIIPTPLFLVPYLLPPMLVILLHAQAFLTSTRVINSMRKLQQKQAK